MYLSNRVPLSKSELKGDGDLSSFKFKNVIFYSYARYALYNLIKNLPSFSKRIYVPSFLCNALTDPLINSKLNIKFYNINNDLSIDFDDLNKIENEDKNGILLVIHYFGFPQDIRKIKDICKDNNLYFIEDCSQALFSKLGNDLLGSLGDASFFSFRKSLAVPDGAALVINNENITIKKKPEKSSLGEEFREKRINSLLAIKERIDKGISNVSKGYYGDLKREEREVAGKSWNLAISDVSKKILGNVNVGEVIKKRRENFAVLLKELKEISIFKDLMEGVCPLGYPVLIKERDEFRKFLWNNGIESMVHWDKTLPAILDRDEFPNVKSLAKKEVTLPIHQGLSIKHMEYMIEKIKEFI